MAGTELTCQNCDHEWTYTGGKDAGAYVTCPNCYYKVRIPKEDEDE